MPGYIVETYQLTKEFRQGRSDKILAVKNVNLQIKRGEIFCLIGPNGAGKSTLLKMLCGLIIPTSGSAKFAGYDILRDADKIKPLIGIAGFTENSFFGRLTGRQNLEFFSALYNLSSRETEAKISNVVEMLGMNSEIDIEFQNLSTGMRQRLAIARSLLSSFELLFLDEPTKSLDATIATRLRDFLKKITKEEKTIFYITHNLKEVVEFSNCIAIMDKGEIKICGDLQEIKKESGVVNKDLEQIFNQYASS